MNYNVQTTITALESLVGFNTTTGYTMPTTLTDGLLKMNDYHPLLQLSVLDNVRPAEQTLSEWLTNVRKTSITTTLNDLMTKKLSSHSIKTKLSDTQIFDSTARFSNILSKRGRFVGWVFRPVKSEHTYHSLTKLALQLTDPIADLPIFIYHSSQKEAIDTRLVTITKSSSVEWVTLLDADGEPDPILLNYIDYDAGGFYYIGYFEDDLINTSAIYKDYDLSVAPCGTCNYFNGKAYKDWSKYVSISTAYVNGSDLDNDDMVSVDKLNIENISNFGLNFRIETYCDITNFLVNNKNMIAPALQVRYAIDLLRYMEFAPLRANAVTDQMKDSSFVAINGQKSENNFIKVRGMIHDYEDYMKGLNLDMSKLDPVCLPSASRGIQWNR
jgi:hypothetical protein